MKTLRACALAVLVTAQAMMLSGCVVESVQGFVDEQTGVLRMVYQAELGRCFEQASSASHFVSCFARVIGRINGQQAARDFVSEMTFLVLIAGDFFAFDPVVVQVPTGMSGFQGTFDDGQGLSGDLVVETGVSCITVRPGQEMCAEAGHELVIFDLPASVTLPSGSLKEVAFEIEAQRGATTAVDVKILFALKVANGGTNLLVPYLPAVTDFADVPVVTIPASDAPQPIEPALDGIPLQTMLEIDLTATPPAALDHFLCYGAKATKGSTKFAGRSGVSLVDQLGTRTASVKKPVSLCTPADKNDEAPEAPERPDHLESYVIKSTPKSAKVTGLGFLDQFGILSLDALKPVGLMVPTTKNLTAPPAAPSDPAVDHFTCYAAKVTKGTAKFGGARRVKVDDQFGTLMLDLKKPVRVCLATNKNGEEPDAPEHEDHLVCYAAKVAKGSAGFAAVRGAFVANQFGAETLDLRKPLELCVPARRVLSV